MAIKYTADRNSLCEEKQKAMFDRFLIQASDLMREHDKLDGKIAKLKERMTGLKVEQDALNVHLPIECQTSSQGRGCGAVHEIKDIVFIQSHWYTSPSGCTGGDYWNHGEGRFVCPTCGVKNRLAYRSWYTQFKPLFKAVEDEYDK